MIFRINANQGFGFRNQAVTKCDRRMRIVLSDKRRRFLEGRRELVQLGLLRNPLGVAM
jgi:hypothetical protein